MKTLGFVTRTLRGSFGGAEVFNDALIKGLAKIGVNVCTYSYDPAKSLSQQRIQIFFRAAFSKEKTLLVSHSGFLDVLLIMLLFIFGKKVSLISHVGPGYRHIDNRYSFFLVKWIIKFAVVNHFLLTDKQALKFNSPNFFIIPSIVRDQFFSKKTNSIDDGYILYYGRISADKGCLDLLNAFSRVGIDCKLVMLGPIDHVENSLMQATIDALQLDEVVSIHAPLRDVEQLVDVIDKARLIVYPSYYDLYPLVIFESFLRGKVCISTHVADNDLLYEDHNMLFNAGEVESLSNLIKFYYEPSSEVLSKIELMKNKFKELSGANCAKKIVNILEGIS